MKTITFKRGTSFGANVSYTPSEGQPADLSGFAISSEVRTPAGSLVATLAVTMAPDAMGFHVAAPEGTATWPLGKLAWDLRFERDGAVAFSETVGLELTREVTQ